MQQTSFYKSLGASHLVPLWAHNGPPLGHEPKAKEPAFHWSWTVLQAFGEQAGDEINAEEAERRVLVLANPAFNGRLATTGTLNAAIQIINPGETAKPHRHSMSAIRLITSRDGGTTTVNDTSCQMASGDLILTPAWSWHGHINDTNRRIMWIDVLDVPLVIGWDGVFFEHPDEAPRFQVSASTDAAWSGAGIVQSDLTSEGDHSPKLRYAWTETKPALDSVKPDLFGHREIHYVNPLNGRPVLPTIDCFATRLESGAATRETRSTASNVFYVVEGEGKSSVGDSQISWSKNDVFTVPHWQWARHQAENGPAYLMRVSNCAMLANLGLLRSESGG